MSVKQKLEDNIAIAVLGFAITGFGAGWLSCEKARVEPKSERIAILEKDVADQLQKIKDGTVAVEPYRRQIDEFVSNTKRLELELENSREISFSGSKRPSHGKQQI